MAFQKLLHKKGIYFKGVSIKATREDIEQALSTIIEARFEKVVLPLKTL